MLLDTILGAVLPMVVTVLLGFVAAWHHDFAVQGRLDPESDGAALRRAAGAFCRNGSYVSRLALQLIQDIPSGHRIVRVPSSDCTQRCFSVVPFGFSRLG
jgi:hypothetical protein